MKPQQFYIDGKWLSGYGDTSYELINPATEEPYARVCDAAVEDVKRAIAAARRSFDDGVWRETPLAERSELLHELAEGLRQRSDEIADIMIGCHGIDHSILGYNRDAAIANIDLYADEALRFPIDEPIAPFVMRGEGEWPGVVLNAISHRQPVGVCGLIPTWNFPLFITVNKIAPALAMGCSVVVKPSPLGPLIDLLIARVLDSLGLPVGVFNVVTGQSSELGAELSTNPDVDMIGFTGSAQVGRALMSAAGASLKRLHLELGGKSALLVCPDADLDAAVPIATRAVIMRAGQACAHLTRVLVPRELQGALVEKMVASVEQNARVGDPSDPQVTVGPLITAERLDAVERLVNEARDDGAIVACGGHRPEGTGRGFFYEPTVLTDVRTSMRIAQEEIFGPVVCVMPFDDLDEAVAIANDSECGLSGGIVTSDTALAVDLAKRIRTGEVVINDGNHPNAPFGGFKQSGLGREMFPSGFEAFTEQQVISWPS